LFTSLYRAIRAKDANDRPWSLAILLDRSWSAGGKSRRTAMPFRARFGGAAVAVCIFVPAAFLAIARGSGVAKGTDPKPITPCRPLHPHCKRVAIMRQPMVKNETQVPPLC